MTTRSERGAAGVWVLCVCALTLTFALSVLTWGSAVGSRHRAAAAADLAALAGAEAQLAGAPQPCAAASRVAAAQGALLSQCVVEDTSVRVVAEVRGSMGHVHLPPARARARAGAGPAALPAPLRAPWQRPAFRAGNWGRTGRSATFS